MAPKNVFFLDGASDDPAQLRSQILSEVKANLAATTNWSDITRSEAAQVHGLTVSFFSDVPADVLLAFDLSDRNIFLLDGPDGVPLVQSFGKILVPGPWMRDRLLANKRLGLDPANVIAVGGARIDLLRRLQNNSAPEPQDDTAGPRILVAPMPDNWRDIDGTLMSVSAEMGDMVNALDGHFDVTVLQDGPNRPGKVPVTQELLDADVVVTDYASVMYEAWALGKPVIFPRWLTGERVLSKAPKSAEAHVYRERIGHHPANLVEMFTLLDAWPDLDIGDGVEGFLTEYLSNYVGADSGGTIAQLLQVWSDPGLSLEQQRAHVALEEAIGEGDWQAASTYIDQIIARDPRSPANFDKQAMICNKLGETALEIVALEKATELSPRSGRLLNRLANAHRKLRHHRAAAKAWEAAIAVNPNKAPAGWHYNMGYMLETPGIDGLPDVPAARVAYDNAVAKDGKAATTAYGVGVLHCNAGRWKEAQAPFSDLLKKQPFDAELYYRLGMAHDRCYEWQEAEACYRKSLTLDMGKPGRHYRLGFVMERQERWDEAAEAYLYASDLAKTHQPVWLYRAGYVLEKAGRLQEACAAFARVGKGGSETQEPTSGYAEGLRTERIRLVRARLDMLPDDAALWMDYSEELEATGDIKGAYKAACKATQRTATPNDGYTRRRETLGARMRRSADIEARLEYDCTNPQEWYRLSEALQDRGDIDGAIDALQQALLRQDDHNTDWYNQLGVLLAGQNRLEEACAVFRSQLVLQRPHGALESKFEQSAALRETATYREFHDTLPLMEKTVLYESFGGEGCSDNPLALFNQVQNDPRFEGWLHIWSILGPEKIPPALRNRKDVIFVTKGSTLYQRYLATVPYLINNATFPFYYVRRDGQHYLNTWHGTPLKTLGYDVEATPLQRANTARNLVQASMFIAPNKHTEEVMLGRYGIKNLFTGTSLISGYPRIDMMINASDTEKARIRKRLGLDPTKPVVLFAPTYRGHWATPELEAQSLVASLERMKSDNYNLVFRGHYFAEKFIDEMNLDVNIAPHAIDTCSLLSVVDVLITDYSSIFYDFLISKRPVIHFVPDWDYYVETRGVYFGQDQLPGHICEDEDSLLETLDRCIEDPQGQITPQYLADLERYCSCEDGKASERVVEALFFDLPAEPVHQNRADGQQHFVYYAGACDTGSDLRNLRGLTGATAGKGHINTVLVDRYLIINDDERTANTQALLDRTDVVMRFGRATLSLEEAWIDSKLKMPNFEPPQAFQEIFETATDFEARRVVGHARFDAAVDLDSSRPFWSQTLSRFDAGTHMAQLGGDFVTARDTLVPDLARVETSLDRFDILLSHSESLRDVNQSNLALKGPFFDTLPPFLDPEMEAGVEADDGLRHIVCFTTEPEAVLNTPIGGKIEACAKLGITLFVPPHLLNTALRQARMNGLYGHIAVHSDTRDYLPALRAADIAFFPQGDLRSPAALAEASVLGCNVVVVSPEGGWDGVLAELGDVLKRKPRKPLTPQRLSKAVGEHNDTSLEQFLSLTETLGASEKKQVS